jgi:hypothetical protein
MKKKEYQVEIPSGLYRTKVKMNGYRGARLMKD